MTEEAAEEIRNLPAVIVPEVPSWRGGARPDASFLAQLMAARQRLPLQRERRRADAEVALGAYHSSEVMAMRRMPQGYRRTVIV